MAPTAWRLVDSEAIANEVLAEILSGSGMAVSAARARSTFVGLSVDDVRLLAAERFGVRMPEDWSADYYAKLISTLGERVAPIDGVEDVLGQLFNPPRVLGRMS
jgi:beta-phosphoglucomutase-like phosphatase (HAD superfamily)